MSRNRWMKRCVALAAGAVIGIVSCMPVFAGNGVAEELCPRCGDGTVWYSEEERNRYPIDQEECTHKRFGVDIQWEIHSICEYECIDCGYGWSEDVYEQYWTCEGTDCPEP